MPSWRGRSRSRAWLWALGLVVVTVAAYEPAMHAGFVWDDDANVTDNWTLQSAPGLYALWLEPGATTQYYPLVYTSFWIEYQLWGLAPAGYHVDNILLHAASALLLWRILLLLGLPAAWLAAAVFALHPVNVESVAWVTERKNVLSGVFYLASGWFYLSRFSDAFAAPVPQRRLRAYLLSFVLFLAALFCKSPTASLPAALGLVIWWKKGRLAREDVIPLLPFAVVSVPIAILTVSMERHVGTLLGFEWAPSPVERLLQGARAAFFYAGKLVWPTDLTFVYPRWDVDDRQAWQYLFPLVAGVLLFVLLRARRRIGRGPLAAVLYFVGTLAPVLGVLEIYFFRFSLVADHWQYLAGIGLIVLVICGGVGRLRDRGLALSGTGARLVAGLLLLVLGTLTWRQSHAYLDSISLWRDSLSKNPHSGMALYNLARDLQLAGRDEEAIPLYRQAIELSPRDPRPLNNLALLLAKVGRQDESLELLREAIRFDPDHLPSRWNLGNALEERGRLDEALEHFEHALAQPIPFDFDPAKWVELHLHLGDILARQGRRRDAAQCYRKVLALDPEHAGAHHRLGVMALRAGRPAQAIRHFDAELALDPANVRARRLRRAAQLRLAREPHGELEAGDEPAESVEGPCASRSSEGG